MHYGEVIIFIVYKTSSWTLLTYIVGCFHLKFIVNSVRLACMQLDEACRLGTCTDTLTRRDKNDSLALSSTATTYVGFSVLPRSINIKSECAAFSIFVCMCASINTRKALNCMRSTLWDFANGRALSQYILTLRKALSTHRGAAQSTTRPKPCIRVKAPPPPPSHVMASGPTPVSAHSVHVVCVNIDTCNVQLKHAQFVLLLVSN